jgi:hypothetical protein
MGAHLALCALLGLAGCVNIPDSPFAGDGPVEDDAGRSGDGGSIPCTDQEVTVSGNTDDGTIYDGVQKEDGEPGGTSSEPGIYMGHSDDKLAWGYFRFALPADFSPAHVDGSIRLRLWGVDTLFWADSSDSLRVVLEDTASAQPVASSDRAPGATPDPDFTTRWPSTDTGLVWDTAGYNESPDLAATFRQLQENHGLEPGQLVQLWVGGFAGLGDAQVAAYDFSNMNAMPAKLRFECP